MSKWNKKGGKSVSDNEFIEIMRKLLSNEDNLKLILKGYFDYQDNVLPFNEAKKCVNEKIKELETNVVNI